MNWQKASPLPASDRGTSVALIFALTAERLSAYYEHGQWLSEAQGATLRETLIYSRSPSTVV